MITSFSGEHRFLSNFWPCRIEYSGLVFRSVEAAYVAAKTKDQEIRKIVSELPSSGACKKYGKTIELRPDWKKVRIARMRSFLEQKFADPELWRLLQKTRPYDLVEGNTWGDRFWGECPLGNGNNHLGELLMIIRDDITRID